MFAKADFLEEKVFIWLRFGFGLAAFILLWPAGFCLWLFLGDTGAIDHNFALYFWFSTNLLGALATIIFAFLGRINGVVVFSVAGTIILLADYFNRLMEAPSPASWIYQACFTWLFFFYLLEIFFIAFQNREACRKKREEKQKVS